MDMQSFLYIPSFAEYGLAIEYGNKIRTWEWPVV